MAANSQQQQQQHKRRRPDGRQSGGSLRPLAAEVSTLHRADGSASLSSGSTTVLAAVYGPAAPRNPSRERSDGAVVTVVFRHSSSASDVSSGSASRAAYGATEREVERFLADAIAATVRTEAYPRTAIEVVVQIIKSDGSAVGTALNAAALALLDAGVEMVGLPIATTCLVLPDGESGNATTSSSADDGGGGSYGLRLDPCAEEESSGEGAAVVIVTNSSKTATGSDGNCGGGGGILSSMSFGTTSLESYLACVEGSARASKAVLAFLRLAVEQKVTREAQTLWSS